MPLLAQFGLTPRRPASSTQNRVRGLRFISVSSFLLSFAFSALATQSVLLSWDPAADPTVAGYNVYYGTQSRSYTNITTAGSALSLAIAGIVEGKTYYFAVTSYDFFGQESVFSDEVSYYAAPRSPKLGIAGGANSTMVLKGTGIAGHVYEIQATTNFTSWTAIATRTAGPDGSFAYTNAVSPYYAKRFFRFRDTTP